MHLLATLPGISRDARSLAARALAANTRRAYAAQWRAWQNYAEGVLPADPRDVANWLADRVMQAGRLDRPRQGPSLATLRSAVSAVRMAHLAAGAAFDTDSPALKLVLKGAARTLTRAPRQAAPLRSPIVANVVRALSASKRDRRDAALLALGYSFALRRSDLVGLDLAKPGNSSGVLIVHADRLEVQLTRSKSHKPGDVCVFVIPRRSNHLVYTVLQRWLAAGDIRPGTPLFRRIRKGDDVTVQRLDAQSVAAVLRRAVALYLQTVGVAAGDALDQAKGYSGHSLRVGLAVTAAEAGADIGAIQQALGHATPTMSSRYSQAAEKLRTSPFRLAGVGLDAPTSRRPRRSR